MTRLAYEYVVLRCMPRVDRGEFLNVAVVLHCRAADYLAAAGHVDEHRLRALDPQVDLERVRSAIDHVVAVCEGAERAGAAGREPLSTRFGFLGAPRSTVVQPGPVHGGLTEDPTHCLTHLLEQLVG